MFPRGPASGCLAKYVFRKANDRSRVSGWRGFRPFPMVNGGELDRGCGKVRIEIYRAKSSPSSTKQAPRRSFLFFPAKRGSETASLYPSFGASDGRGWSISSGSEGGGRGVFTPEGASLGILSFQFNELAAFPIFSYKKVVPTFIFPRRSPFLTDIGKWREAKRVGG